MKIKKYIMFSILLNFLVNMFCFVNIKAFTISGSKSVYVGSTISITINAKGEVGRYDYSTSNSSVLSGSNSLWLENETKTVYFTAKSAGTATITVKSKVPADLNGNDIAEQTRTLTVNVINKPTNSNVTINPSYSSNNYLKSLNVENYNLTPSFNKDTLEYNIEVEPGTEKISISAEKEDSKSTIKGIGQIEVNEGNNEINIIVTAENGNEKKYKLNVVVPEKDPINVKINNIDYTVVKKMELINSLDGYEKTTVVINSIEIPALYNPITEVTLVGLKDKKGNVVMFLYDSSTGEYKEYEEFSFDKMNLYIHDNLNNNYESKTIKLNGKDVKVYIINGVSDYYLIYATNTITGYEGYYLYDIKENSVQRYDSFMLNKITKEKDKYLALVLVLSCVCFLTMLFLLIEVNKKNKGSLSNSVGGTKN